MAFKSAMRNKALEEDRANLALT